MSLDKPFYGNLKSRNFVNLHLTPNNISLNRNSVKNKSNPYVKYYNNLTKNNIYSNYSNNIKTKKKSVSSLNKTNVTPTPKNSIMNVPKTTDNKKEKLNITYAPVLTNTTKDSTINSSTSKAPKKQEPFFYEGSPKDTLNTLESAGESNKKIKEPENDDIKFLYSVFYNYNNSKENNLRESKNNRNRFNFNELRKYLIINEKSFKNEGNILLYQSTRASGLVLDFYFIKKLESLIARFSLVIFIFVKCEKLDEAREIFLLMLKENRIYLDYIEKKVFEYYSITNKKINIAKDYPRMTYELIRIYSFIIKYSQFFNMMNYRNIFLGRYLELLYFIYNFFNIKGNTRMFNIETKNQLIYWFSYALHNASYYSTSTYFPMETSINLSNYIIHLYQNLEDHNLTDSEKSLIIKTYYNLGLFYYLNGKKDEALFNLDKAKDRIANIEENDIVDTSFYQMNIKKKDSINILVPKTKKNDNNLLNNSTTEENPLTNRLSTNISMSENKNNKNINSNGEETPKKEKEKTKNKKSNIIERICKGFSKKKNDLEDIKLLINYGVKKGLITEINKPENEYRHKFRKLFRGSHINLSTTFRVKDFLIPYYFNNPLLRKVELLMGEIELDKKNYISAYDHILRAFYILISLKINRTIGNQKEFSNEQKIIDKYLTLIEKYKDEEIKNKERQKSEANFKDINNTNMNSFNTSNVDSFQENFKDELNDIMMDKYNLNNDDTEEKNEEDDQEILVCGNLILDFKVLKEIEKFFIFLNSLSLFQIKILNETQPDNVKRNDLPILFPSQFKDCLSSVQRIELDNLQTMALSRFIVLKDPNKWIMPNNLNIDIIRKSKYEVYEKMRIEKIKNEEKYIPIKETKEYKYYQKIISSEKSNKEIKEFLKTNFDLVIKILKQSSEEEIKNIINFPYIIIDPVKNFKKRRKRKLLKLKKEGYDISKQENRKFNYLLLNNYDFDHDDYSPRRHENRLRTFTNKFKSKSSRFKSNNIKYNYNLAEKITKDNYEKNNERNRTRSRNKSVHNKIIPNWKKSYEEEEVINDKNDYNDSYQDNLISPEDSFEH